MEKVIIGLDSGGTKTKIAILSKKGDILYQDMELSGSPAVVGEEIAMHNIHLGLQKVVDYGKKIYQIECIVLGISGLGVIKDKTKYGKKYQEEFNVPVFIESDAILALYSVITNQYDEGVIVLAGTGAAILGINKNVMKLYSGWGHLLTERGSAYSVVRDMLCGSIRHFEKTGKIDKLGKKFMEYMHFSSLTDFRSFMYQNTKREIASYSLFVDDMAKSEKSKEAIRILKKAGRDLASDVINAVKGLNLTSNAILGFRGGFISNCSYVQEELIFSLMRRGIKLNFLNDKKDPIIGAIYIANRRCRECWA